MFIFHVGDPFVFYPVTVCLAIFISLSVTPQPYSNSLALWLQLHDNLSFLWCGFAWSLTVIFFRATMLHFFCCRWFTSPFSQWAFPVWCCDWRVSFPFFFSSWCHRFFRWFGSYGCDPMLTVNLFDQQLWSFTFWSGLSGIHGSSFNLVYPHFLIRWFSLCHDGKLHSIYFGWQSDHRWSSDQRWRFYLIYVLLLWLQWVQLLWSAVGPMVTYQWTLSFNWSTLHVIGRRGCCQHWGGNVFYRFPFGSWSIFIWPLICFDQWPSLTHDMEDAGRLFLWHHKSCWSFDQRWRSISF